MSGDPRQIMLRFVGGSRDGSSLAVQRGIDERCRREGSWTAHFPEVLPPGPWVDDPARVRQDGVYEIRSCDDRDEVEAIYQRTILRETPR